MSIILQLGCSVLPLGLPFGDSGSVPGFVFMLISRMVFLFPFLRGPGSGSLLLLLVLWMSACGGSSVLSLPY